ncbi:hypothetical protein IKW75_01340, partial [Candidatus Saccharibacteria bacterium]|nr:hypothetical protein [Candidatus Saccharibacteria bacterium]
MKNTLVTATLTAIVCAGIAYFVCGIFLPGVDDVSFPTLSGTTDFTLLEPDAEVFNYRAINPTVEVYVGDCDEYDENGECLDAPTEDVLVEDEETEAEEETLDELENLEDVT